MNAVEHYQEAERLLARADQDNSADWLLNTGEQKADILAAAQVHATLAESANHAALLDWMTARAMDTLAVGVARNTGINPDVLLANLRASRTEAPR